jgi:hypothetical protein
MHRRSGAFRDAGVALAAVAFGACMLAPQLAHAFCRTTTSQVPADYDPSSDGCWTQGLPVYWANACVSYDIQQDVSHQIDYDTASADIATAFSKWTGTICPGAGDTAGRVSIDVRDFGPVACGTVQYNQNGPNQHVIVFRDESWPYHDDSNALALTTVTYDKVTGEIYDADMEINTAQQTLSTTDADPSGGYDFLSIVTHETGHFLGMAHSTDDFATMYAYYATGDTVMRDLTEDDVTGICSIYSPDGLRHVSTAASSTGTLPEEACDPTPRHGFTTQCMSTPSSCAVARVGTGGRGAWSGLAAVLVGLIAARRRRRAAPCPKAPPTS